MLSALLLGLIALGAGAGALLWRGLAVILQGLALATFALLATVMLTRALRLRAPVGVSGAASIFGVVLALLSVSVLVLAWSTPAEWLLRGRLVGLPTGRPAIVHVGECTGRVEDGSGLFRVPIHGSCDREVLQVIAQVDGYREQNFALDRARAQQEVALDFRAEVSPAAGLSGVVLRTDGVHRRAVEGATLMIESCQLPDERKKTEVVSDALGRFSLSELPPSCRGLPYLLGVYRDGHYSRHEHQRATGIEVVLAAGGQLSWIQSEGPGIYRVQLDAPPATYAAAYELGGGLLALGQPPGGTLLTLSPPPKAGAAALPLSETELAQRLAALRPAPDAVLERALQLWPKLEAPRRMLMERYRSRASDAWAAIRHGRSPCSPLREQRSWLERGSALSEPGTRASWQFQLVHNCMQMKTLCPGLSQACSR